MVLKEVTLKSPVRTITNALLNFLPAYELVSSEDLSDAEGSFWLRSSTKNHANDVFDESVTIVITKLVAFRSLIGVRRCPKW